MIDTPLILALGNPILSDDRVGLEVGQLVHARLPEGAATLVEAAVGGLELLPLFEGRRRVLIVDAVEPGRLPPGEARVMAMDELERGYTPITPHNAGLLDALALGRALGLEMPEDLVVFAIGVRDPYTFAEQCTEEVAAAVPAIVERIVEGIFGPKGRWPR
jgi:hydrogenase maturation protease